MSSLNKDQIKQILSTVVDIYKEQDLISANMIDDIAYDKNNNIVIKIILDYAAKSYHFTLTNNIKDAFLKANINNIVIDITTNIVAYSVQKSVDILPGVKNIIAVASGKGGVGKSTIAVNLSLALQLEGANVALFDADIYGPSQPKMLGVSKEKPKTTDGGKLLPVLGHGMQSMSIGYLVSEESPMIWRGPMVTQALGQMLRDTKWSNVDYMIIDLPPGTGDTQLTLSQKIPVSGSIIVTTPQDIALIDAKKGLKMFEKVNIPILGIIENMSLHTCPKCGYEEDIFGSGGGLSMAKDANVNFLGSLPLDKSICSSVDSGIPSIIKEPDSKISKIYREIARKTGAKLTMQDKAISAFPEIVIK